jgi:hypothetical protein
MRPVGKKSSGRSGRWRGTGRANTLDRMRKLLIVTAVVAALAGGTTLAVAAKGGGTKTQTSASNVQYGTGDDGCTPGYWKNHTNVWSGFSPGDLFNTVFGVNFNPTLTLAGALNLGGGGFNALARQATAALLGEAHPDVDYGLTNSQIISLVQQAFATNNPEPAKNLLDRLNNAGCSIDAHGRPID